MPSIRMPIDTHNRLPDTPVRRRRYVSERDVVVDATSEDDADGLEAEARLLTADVDRIRRW
ncbi:hypothetical protein M9979_11190 [Sphingomonas sp. RP10(2022)]|uniref:Uncharacterized protein n=1 Tax=Sphingomonas liriopis TaxID=2949094 RepID=A0A9X2HTY2_9SPHN|nr:hypothetical protein [Sphingomonas liriopis]MCP3735434.1 hypothetical protein [Sphingomonas liriopis]